ncbi:glycosyltransferase family protein [Rhizobium laguerreae]|uniref:glycosyltransferase family protein n=2 Tax=Rhizobium laguerreae TaxID=1076926 RepID=UPI0021B10883|nr:glycosyltransferase [Rhizobium laguerreae]
MMLNLDIVYVADVRFEGGTSTALAAEITAAAKAGLRTGLLAVKGPLITLPFQMHPELRRLIDEGLTERLDPEQLVRSAMVQVHHPTIMENRPDRPVNIIADMVLVVLHHPVLDAADRIQYDLHRVTQHVRETFGRPAILAPVSAVVRSTLPVSLRDGVTVLDINWDNLLDIEEWDLRPDRPVSQPIVIGRHSRPDPLKWPLPAEVLQIYPSDATRYRIRVLGGGAYLTDRYGNLPSNWEIFPFAWEGVSRFLVGLDFYVYFHDPSWSEAFGRTILEALAVGLVVVLPPTFERLFQDAAVYSVPAHVERVIQRYSDDPDLYREQSTRARSFVANNHAAASYADRIRKVLGQSPDLSIEQQSPRAIDPLPQRNVLFMSSNGIGVGHLTQQLAIAQRLPRTLNSVFTTMAYSMRVAAEAGFQCHFLPHHRVLGAEAGDWNNTLAEELFDLIAHLRPTVFAYDATAVFDGVARCLSLYPELFKVWVRRPMWRQEHAMFLDYSDRFDAVIEPGELAQDFDHGPTASCRHEVLVVPPVLHIDPRDRIRREDARDLLDLPDDATVVAIQLGAGINFDMGEVRNRLIRELLRHPKVIALEIRSPIAVAALQTEPLGERHRIVSLFPSFRYSKAFDAAISAAGYNAFHEQVLGAIPTLFVPNEAEEMDLQINRGRWASLTGHGWLLRRDFDLPLSARYVEQLLDPLEQQRIASRCAGIEWTNGAAFIARFLEDHARMVRTDRDLSRG